MKTRTGNFPIAFRRGWGEWTRDLASLSAWAQKHEFEAIDLMKVMPEHLKTLSAHSLSIGSVDLLDFGNLMSTDEAKRKSLIEQNVAYIRQLAPLGAKVFFTCIIPGDPAKPRSENYKLALDTFAPIAAAADSVGAKIAIEGWPGGAPHFATLCCTPETYRSFMKDLKSPSIGVNYDPSHLIRLGVDHIRFLREFANKVWHVHAKDTAIYPEAVYEMGLFQPSVFEKPFGYGAHTWRYTIPGHGVSRWVDIFAILQNAGYRGAVSVELEDQNFNGTDAGEQNGLIHSRDFLRSC